MQGCRLQGLHDEHNICIEDCLRLTMRSKGSQSHAGMLICMHRNARHRRLLFRKGPWGPSRHTYQQDQGTRKALSPSSSATGLHQPALPLSRRTSSSATRERHPTVLFPTPLARLPTLYLDRLGNAVPEEASPVLYLHGSHAGFSGLPPLAREGNPLGARDSQCWGVYEDCTVRCGNCCQCSTTQSKLLPPRL